MPAGLSLFAIPPALQFFSTPLGEDFMLACSSATIEATCRSDGPVGFALVVAALAVGVLLVLMDLVVLDFNAVLFAPPPQALNARVATVIKTRWRRMR